MDTAVTKAAYELIFRFQDESDIPKRLNKDKSQVSLKHNIDSLVEQRFKIHVKAWTETINSILKHVNDKNQGWRFIRCNPEVIDTSITSVTLCKDFLDFTDLLVQRRDIDMCDDDELGKLCMLHTAFQRKIEKRINQQNL